MKREQQPHDDLYDLLPILLAEARDALGSYQAALGEQTPNPAPPYNHEDETDD